MSLGSLSPPASLDFWLAVPLAHEVESWHCLCKSLVYRCKMQREGVWKRAGDTVGLVNEADTFSSLVISYSRARTRETKGDRRCGGQRPGAGEWAIPKSPPGALLWKKEMATRISFLREPCGSEEGRDRWKPYRGRNPYPTVVSWNCAVRAKQNLGSEVVMWEVDPKGVPRRVTRFWHSLSGAPAVATGSHCFAAGLPSRPMITLGDSSVLSNT